MKVAKRIVVWGALVIVVTLFGSCPTNSLLTDVQEKVHQAQAGVPVTGVSLNPTSLNLMVGGATGTLTATITPANATNKNVTWSSSATGVATVSGGVVTPVSVGTATITVTTVDGNKTATCAVTVGTTNVPVTGVSLSPATLNLVVGGATGTLTPTITPANATNTNVSWSTSNPLIATVNATGVVTPVGQGSATITVTTVDGNKTATCAVTVGITTVPVTGVSLSPATLSLKTGGAQGTLTATITPSNATNQNVSWTSSNPAVATVPTTSSTTNVVTPVSGGTTTITVTTADGNHTATCTVTVTVPVAGVSLSPTTLKLQVGGGSSTLTATITPANATNLNVSWSSSNTSAATVSGGVVTPTVPSGQWGGTATITVATQDGNYMATCTVTVSYLIGSTGTGGGLICYDSIASTGNTFIENGITCRYLEAAPSDQSTGIWWGGGVQTGATGTAVGTGASNTAAIIAAQGAGSYAASVCHSYTGGGKTDWFLPSQDELIKMYGFLYLAGFGGPWLATSSSYWSSTEPVYHYQGAIEVYFINGVPDSTSKSTLDGVRAARAW